MKKKTIVNIIKISASFALAFFLVWYGIKDFINNDEYKTEVLKAFGNVNYFWISMSVFVGILSHLIRAYRWKYTLEPLNLKPKLINSFFAVMIGYMANFAFPRIGEVSRCVFMSRFDNKPIDKLFGTVIAERIADLLILMILIATTFFIELNVLSDYVKNTFLSDSSKEIPLFKIILFIALSILFVAVFLWLLKKSKKPFTIKIKDVIKSIWQGVISIFTMKKKLKFLLLSFLIWVAYYAMFYFGVLAISGLNISFGAILAAFIFGGIAIAITPGGLGAYPLVIMQILILYGVQKTTGFAFGWIMWGTQSAMIMIVGTLSFILMPILNKKSRQ